MKAKKAMKAMKKRSMKKSMKKSMRRRAMKVSIIARNKYAKRTVFNGNKTKTVGGLKKGDLMKNKNGKVVSKKAHANGKKAFKRIQKWTAAVQKARKQMGVKGFVAVKKGTALYKKAHSIFRK